jgi:hypothetical protein
MDRVRIEREMRELQDLIDDPPPLLTVVILANGSGLAYPYPLFDQAGEDDLEHRRAVLQLVRAFMAQFVDQIDTKLFDIDQAKWIYRKERGERVERPQGDG